MFRGQNQRVRFEPGHGMEVTAHGRISVYAPHGRYQLIVDEMLPAGQGDLHLAFENLRKKLQQEGLFEASLKQALPRFPRRIGIVTSPTGAAIQDMLNILGRRFPLAEVLLLPVKVQGAGAAEEIARAIQDLNDLNTCDVLIVGRGGGSLEDLWAFNEEVVARAIAGSRIPVVSAVGHETDTTISDYVADRRAPTPSAAAELVVPDASELDQRLLNLRQGLQRNLQQRIENQIRRLDALGVSYALKRPALMIEQYMQRLDILEDHALRSNRERLRAWHAKLDLLSGKVETLNPLRVLEKGYAVLQDGSGALIRSVDQVLEGTRVIMRLRDGRVEATTQAVKKEKKG